MEISTAICYSCKAPSSLSLHGPKCRSLTRMIAAATAVDADGEGLQRGGPEAAAVVKVGREPVVPRRSGSGQDPWFRDRLDDQ